LIHAHFTVYINILASVIQCSDVILNFYCVHNFVSELDQFVDFQELNIINPLQRQVLIADLQNDTAYTIHIWAVNAAGRGAVTVIETTTLPVSGFY
jgi:6-pyruvoyl-tetrahydropterin synthase